MKRSRTTIRKEYETFVKAFESVCKVLDWKVQFKQDIDRLLQVVIDGCVYNVAPQQNDSPEHPVYYLSVMVQYSGNRHEPPSEDEKSLAQGFREPRRAIVALIDAHWQLKREWAIEQDWIPEDEQER